MNIYIAMLRGINVGTKNRIKMEDLRKIFEAIGLCEVKTYIQSGNVIFKSMESEKQLQSRIEQKLQSSFGFPVMVILRTAYELQWSIHNCPFSQEEVMKAEAASDTESLYVIFLNNVISEESIERLNVYKSDNNEFRIEGREVFLLCYDSIRKSKVASNLQKLDPSATVRNWKTVNKLSELAKTLKLK